MARRFLRHLYCHAFRISLLWSLPSLLLAESLVDGRSSLPEMGKCIVGMRLDQLDSEERDGPRLAPT